MNFFPSRHRCCKGCSQRRIKVNDQEVTEYYHRGVVCNLIGFDLALPLDMELIRPGEGEVAAAMRLLERVFANYRRFFDAVAADALYMESPFFNFCLERDKNIIAVLKGNYRSLLEDAKPLTKMLSLSLRSYFRHNYLLNHHFATFQQSTNVHVAESLA